MQIVVNDGDTGRAIGATLREGRRGQDAPRPTSTPPRPTPGAAAIQPGSYTMKKQMTAPGRAGDPRGHGKNRSVPRVTVREGLWKSEVFAALSKGTGVPVAEYTAAAKDAAALGLPAARQGQRRGLPVPRDLRVPGQGDGRPAAQDHGGPGASPSSQKAGVGEADYQKTLIVASIVEGEAGVADRGKVARVVENRLDNPTGPTVGLLQMDSTVNFALQKRGNLTKAEYDSAKSNPYDTYAHKGLPPGPISSPGRQGDRGGGQPDRRARGSTS